MEIALTGEGKTDYGMQEYGSTSWKWGPIAYYIKNIAQRNNVDVNLSPITREEIKGFKLQRSMKNGISGHGIPARKFAYLMKNKGYQYGIFYCDADREAGAINSEHQADKRFEKVYVEVEQGLNVSGINAIPMIALRMIETWIMGDKSAIEKALDISIPDSLFPQKPELLWGDVHDPQSNYPKHYFNRMVSSCDKKHANYSSNMEDFCAIAEASDVETVKKTCGISFGKFYDDFEKMIT